MTYSTCIAHARRGHDKTYFVMYWTSEIAMCLAKRGAEVALRHAYKTAANNVLGLEDGVFGDAGVEAPIVVDGGRA